MHVLTRADASMRVRTGVALGALFLGLGAAGCSSSGSTTPADTGAQQARPLDGVTYYDPAQRALLHDATERRVAQCMRTRGFGYRPQPLAASDHTADGNPYGLLTPAQARNDGFGLTSSALDARPFVDANAAADGGQAWKDALDGTAAHRVYLAMPGGRQFFYNADACSTQAVAQVYGADYYRLYETMEVLAGQVVTTVQADDGVHAAESRWRSCMAAAGERSADLDAPLSAVTAQLHTALASGDRARVHAVAGRELSLAETDAGCQETSGLAAAVATAQARAEQPVRRSHAADLAALRALQRTALSSAARTG
ncbi:hypothetical protein [Streptacidiphilus rugosus]|uniref:hypothetical protein n=1 Tax=Streptacidiphilus rugosus TaxID=405783 RepID=UPI000ACAEFAB|nr:hypothetical protein [Streptacidiphilus rugosus]